MMEDFLTKNGFKKKTHKGQEVWQEGDGFLTMARFIRYEYNDGSFHLEAWIGKKRENPIKGFVGAMPKKMFRESLEELIRLLHQPLPQGQEDTGNKVITIQVPDHGKCAVPAMILSILGIVVGLLLSPLGGIVLGRTGNYLRTEGPQLQQKQYRQGGCDSGYHCHGGCHHRLHYQSDFCIYIYILN